MGRVARVEAVEGGATLDKREADFAPLATPAKKPRAAKGKS